MNTLQIPAPAKTRTRTITYWTATGLFAALMLADGIAGVAREANGQEAFRQLGYPIYFMSILGVAKLLGAVALVQTRFTTLKEWAYAGFTINFLSAAASWWLVGKGFDYVAFPLVALALLFGTYYLWKRVSR
jgi:hypothetical protein